MSRIITSIRFAATAIILLFATMRPAAAQNYQDYQDDEGGSASYQQFYDDLSPYGEWVDDPEYGYVWIPDAGDDFRPYYSNGYWANTEYGNTWVSNYDWGWAPFHYGRWTYSSYYGWIWIPGNEWGPAWVSWRSGGGSYGWAPLGPGVSISMAFGNYYAPDYWGTFTPQQYILSPNFHNYCYGPRYNSNYLRQTTIINNSYVRDRRTYIAGPRRNELERAIGRPVQQYSISNINSPNRAEVRGNSLAIYRPQIAETRPRATERPRRFTEVRQPITNAPSQMIQPADRAMNREAGRDRNQQWQQQGGTDRTPARSPMQDRAPVSERPFRGRENNQIERAPQENRAPVTERPFRGRENNQIERAPQQDRAPVYQQPDRSFDRQPSRQSEIQRGQQVDQQRLQQQRDEQVQQQRMQQQRAEQMQQQQQRNDQIQQQRMMQQRDQQMQQQRMQQMQQQRDEQAQQQRMLQQRNEQMQQQRMQQMQQRSEQRPQAQPQRIERPMMEQRQQPAQRIEAPRNESPRPAPQQEARPEHGGGRFRR
jgi:hypothetical protein